MIRRFRFLESMLPGMLVWERVFSQSASTLCKGVVRVPAEELVSVYLPAHAQT